MADTLQILRGLYANLPTLAIAELALTTDTKQVWVGTSTGNELVGGISDHGALSGLLDDDHTQYLPLTGIRAMTGPLKLQTGSNAVQLKGMLADTLSVVNGADTGWGNILANGIQLEDVLYTDTIGEKTANAGVTIDGLLIKDGVAGSGNTKKLFISAGNAEHAHSGFGGAGIAKTKNANNYPTLEFEHTEIQRGSFSFIVPQDYKSGGTLKIVYIDNDAGFNKQVVLSVQANSLEIDDNHTSGNSSDLNNAITIYTDSQVCNWTASGISLTYTKGDYVGVKVTREATHASDTSTYALRVMGIQFEYTT